MTIRVCCTTSYNHFVPFRNTLCSLFRILTSIYALITLAKHSRNYHNMLPYLYDLFISTENPFSDHTLKYYCYYFMPSNYRHISHFKQNAKRAKLPKQLTLWKIDAFHEWIARSNEKSGNNKRVIFEISICNSYREKFYFKSLHNSRDVDLTPSWCGFP